MFALHKSGPNPECPVGRNICSVLGEIYADVEAGMARQLSCSTLACVVGKLRDHEAAMREPRTTDRPAWPCPRLATSRDPAGQRKIRWAKRYRLFFHSVESWALPSTCQTCGTSFSLR